MSETIEIENVHQGGKETLFQILNDNREVCIQIPLYSINSTNSYINIIIDYIEASYIAESISKYAQRIDLKINRSLFIHPVVELIIEPNNVLELSEEIYNLSEGFDGKDDQARLDFISNAEQHEKELEGKVLVYPELIDDYYANLVNGAHFELAYEAYNGDLNDSDEAIEAKYFEDIYKKYPEQKFGYWKSAFSKTIGHDFYCSTVGWIIPNSSEFSLIVKEYGGIDNLKFMKADFFALGNISYIISEGLIIHFPFGSFLQAKRCAHDLLKDDFGGWGFETWIHRFLTFNRGYSQLPSSKENYKGYPEDRTMELITHNKEGDTILLPPDVVCFYLSEYGDHLLVKDSNYSYLFFGTDKLAHNELMSLGNRLSILFHTTLNLAGIHVEIKCPWENLDDEKFEELCYDIIYHNPKFDNSTIRKMGKSRSRDGKRDIVVNTHSRPGYQSEKYIFQCKYLQPGSSLTATKVIDISDTVDQYAAQGFGIMTSVVIDATLYDKLDGISQRKGIKTQEFSVYELERILARYDNIKQRHFN